MGPVIRAIAHAVNNMPPNATFVIVCKEPNFMDGMTVSEKGRNRNSGPCFHF